MIRTPLIVALAALATACASDRPDKTSSADPQPVLPTEQFAATVQTVPDQILLAPHAEGLSGRQSAALADLVGRWREQGGGPITVQAPAGGGEAAAHTTDAVQAALADLGVARGDVRVAGYDAQGPGAPVMVGFPRYEARGPECGREWKSFSRSGDNRVNNNFGCAVTANFAAMVANPADLDHPRAMDPADAQRRATVLTKYRAGEATASAKDDQANGAVSTAVH